MTQDIISSGKMSQKNKKKEKKTQRYYAVKLVKKTVYRTISSKFKCIGDFFSFLFIFIIKIFIGFTRWNN